MNFFRIAIITIALFAGHKSSSQVITTLPVFPTKNDTVTIFYHADRGNKALDGIFPVYAHTGVITSNSTSDSDWQHVVGVWASPDSLVSMTYVSPEVYKLVIPIREFYKIDDDEEVLKLAFVFRNVDGSKVGRNANGSDIFIKLRKAEKLAVIISPPEPLMITSNDILPVMGQSLTAADLTLFIDDISVALVINDTQIKQQVNTSGYKTGKHSIKLKAVLANKTIYDSTSFTIIPDPEILPLPEGIKEGVNTDPEHSDRVTLNLFASGKKHIYLLGDFNNWEVNDDYLLNNDPSGDYHWIEITELDPEVEYGYQYFIIEDDMRKADPFNKKKLNPWDSEKENNGSKPYPVGLTTGIISVFQTDKNREVQNQSKPLHYRISGSVENIDNVNAYLARKRDNDYEYLNKVWLSEGKFEMEGSISVPENLFLIIGEFDAIHLFSLFLGGDNVTIAANYDSLAFFSYVNNMEIFGAPLQAEAMQFFESIESLQSIEQNQNINAENSKINLIDPENEFENRLRNSVFEYVKDNPASPISPFIVRNTYHFANIDLDDLKTLDAYFDSSLNDSPDMIYLRERIKNLEKIAVGKEYINFSLSDTSGAEISISDYEGKYILIDFWASWCAPCRKEYPELKKTHQKYKDKGFTIIGVSIDENLANWKKAIVKDKVEWIQIIDPNGFNSEAVKTYEVQGVPYKVLINPEGIIIDIGFISMPELNVKLEEIFGY